jgi:phosphoglycerate dehydrogenase-like enzyme
MGAAPQIRVACLGFVFDPVAQEIVRRVAPPHLSLSFAEWPEHMTDDMLATCDVIMGVAAVTDDMMGRAPHLRMIQKWGAGYDQIDVKAAERRGIAVAITAGVNANTIAEHAIMLMMAVLRRLVVADRAFREGRWIPHELRPQSKRLYGKTVGIVGFGNIGRAVARQLQGFNTRTLFYSRTKPVDAALPPGATYVPFEQLLAESDVITLHCPGGGANRDLINKDTLARMKPGAVLINTARGNLVVEDDLVDALESGHLSGAGLDVFAEEPLRPQSRLRGLQNVVLTPHAAGSIMDDIALMAGHAFENIMAFLRGDPIRPADLIVSLPRGGAAANPKG